MPGTALGHHTPGTCFSLVLCQVETEDKFEWVGGSSIGGGTFWGLGALLTKTKVPGGPALRGLRARGGAGCPGLPAASGWPRYRSSSFRGL